MHGRSCGTKISGNKRRREFRMNIRSKRSEGILVLSLEGRLDAQGAGELENFLRDNVGMTDNTVVFDMSEVMYLSSAGIRIIITSEKKMRSRKGGLFLSCIQPYPLSVLEMTGFSTVLALHPTCNNAVQAARSLGASEKVHGELDVIPLHTRGAEYKVTRTGRDLSILRINGYPFDTQRKNQVEETSIPVTISTETCSMGWGAPGQQDGQSASLMGDLLTLGNIAVWLPPDSHDNPDYLILDRKETGIPLTASFLLSPSGPARYRVDMKSDSEEGITLSDLFDALFDIVRRIESEYKGVLFLSFCAESPEVYFYNSILDEQSAVFGGEFHKQEDSFSGVILAGCTVAVDSVVQPAHFKGAVADALIHRFPHSPGITPRIMSLLFPYLPVNKEKSTFEMIEQGLYSGVPVFLRHLSPRTLIRTAIFQISVISDIVLNTGPKIIIEGNIQGWNPEFERIVKIVHHDCSEVRLHPISGGFSGSLVFRDDADDHHGRREMPFVLKLDRWDTIRAEVEGYEGHVKRYIQNNATQIIQHERCGDYGGILYTFVGIHGPQSRIFSLEEFYLAHTQMEVLEIFDILFRKVLRTWYGQPRLRDLPLYRLYAGILNYEGVKQWAESRYGISSKDEYLELPHGMGRSLNPLYFMEFIIPERLSWSWSVYEGSVHGDLNMKNVLMDDENNIWLIDFAMTAHSHILRDIAKLESVLKMEMIPIESEERLLLLLNLEHIFLRPKKLGEIPELPEELRDPDIEKAFTVVKQLRRYADSITLLDEDIRQYYLALLHYTLCIPAYASVNEYMKEYAWISSSLLCNALK
jgi:anti-anti-sigma factor